MTNFLSPLSPAFVLPGQSLVLALALALAGCSDPVDPPVPVSDAGAPDASPFLSEDLAMPATPTLSLDRFTPSQTCGGCHPRHYVEWRMSMHAYAMVDPVYREMVKIRQADFDGAQDRFCLQCHTPIGTRAGDVVPGFDFADLDDFSLEGVNCETCHRISEVARTHNSGMVIDQDGPIRGPIENPLASEAHLSEYSPLMSQSEVCAVCHDVLEVSGLELERPYFEWLESPAYEQEENCQSCHMPTYTGTASLFSDERPDIHSHYFVGVDLPLTDDFVTPTEIDEMRVRTQALLVDSGSVSLYAVDVQAGSQLDVFVDVRNNIHAHNLPTGSTFNRQMWLELTATDGNGQILYQTGDLDGNGDLRDHFSELDPYGDQDLVTFSSRLVDDSGTPELFSWRASDHFSNSLPPLYERTFTLFVPTEADTVGPITIDARLRFRSFAPHLLRLLGLGDKVARLEIFDIASASLQVNVATQ